MPTESDTAEGFHIAFVIDPREEAEKAEEDSMVMVSSARFPAAHENVISALSLSLWLCRILMGDGVR